MVSINNEHINVSVRRWKNKRKVKLKIMSEYPQAMCKQTLPLKAEQYGKGNKNWRCHPLKSKFFSSALCDTILLTACLGKNHNREKKKNPNYFYGSTRYWTWTAILWHPVQAYCWKNTSFFFQRLTCSHPIKILQHLTKLFLESQYQIHHFARYFRNTE